MAELNKSILGKVKGSIGELTFRQRNGKNIISVKPSSFVPGTDAASIDRRKRFKLSVKLAKEINHIPYVKAYWNNSLPAGLTIFNLIFKTNYKYISPNDITGPPMVFPVYGFNISNPNAVFNASSIDISFDAIGNAGNIDTNVETDTKLLNIIFLSEPDNSSFAENYLFSAESESKPLQLTDSNSFTVNIPEEDLQFYTNYQTKKIFSVLLTYDSSSNLVHFSSTFES